MFIPNTFILVRLDIGQTAHPVFVRLFDVVRDHSAPRSKALIPLLHAVACTFIIEYEPDAGSGKMPGIDALARACGYFPREGGSGFDGYARDEEKVARRRFSSICWYDGQADALHALSIAEGDMEPTADSPWGTRCMRVALRGTDRLIDVRSMPPISQATLHWVRSAEPTRHQAR